MKLVISGSVPSQKNRKIISHNSITGRPFLRSAPQVTIWKEKAILELREQFQGYIVTEYPISITLIFYFDSLRRHDLDNAAAGVMDALVAAQVIEDDSIKFVDCLQLQYGGHDKTNPRAEIFLDDPPTI